MGNKNKPKSENIDLIPTSMPGKKLIPISAPRFGGLIYDEKDNSLSSTDFFRPDSPVQKFYEERASIFALGKDYIPVKDYHYDLIEGAWYVHLESPGFLIRIDNLKKSIASGWTGSGRAFENEYTFLSKRRLRLAQTYDVADRIQVKEDLLCQTLNMKLQNDLKPIRLGRKQQRVVLDDRNFGHEVLKFNPKYAWMAPEVIKVLNNIKHLGGLDDKH